MPTRPRTPCDASRSPDAKFVALDPLGHGSKDSSFHTIDFSKVNEARYQWQKIDTFQTPAKVDMEDGASSAVLPDLLSNLRNEILEATRADLQCVVSFLRQEVDRSVKQTTAQVKRYMREKEQNTPDPMSLLAEIARAQGSPTETGARESGALLLEELQAVKGGVEAGLESVRGMRAGLHVLATRQGKVEEEVSEMLREQRRLNLEVAEIHRVKTELEYRNAREKRVEAEVSNVLGEVRELRTGLEASNLSAVSCAPEEARKECSVDTVREIEAQVSSALKSNGRSLQELRTSLSEMESANYARSKAFDSSFSDLTSSIHAEMASLLRAVRFVKADVDLRILREGPTRDVKIFVSHGQREEEEGDEELQPSAVPARAAPTAPVIPAASAVPTVPAVPIVPAIPIVPAALAAPTAPAAAAATSAVASAVASPVASSEGRATASVANATANPADCTIANLSAVAHDELERSGGSSGSWRSQGVVAKVPANPADRTIATLGTVAHEELERSGGSSGSSRSEGEDALRAVFKRVDVNGSGTISIEETIKALRKHERFARALGFKGTVHLAQQDGTREAFRKVFNSVDADSDNKISWEELKLLAAHHRRRMGIVTASHEESEASDVVSRRGLDDTSTRLEEDGPRSGVRIEEPQARKGDLAELRAMFDTVDVDGSGSISMIEAIKALNTNERFARAMGFDSKVRVRQEDGTRDRFCRAFQLADPNDDRKISWEELLALAQQQMEEAFDEHGQGSDEVAGAIADLQASLPA